VSQLQDQHYEQYMEHVQSQLLLHQRQQRAQLHSLTNKNLPVAMDDAPPSDQLVEFHTEAGVAAETCHHDDEVAAAVTEGEMNGASDVALLPSSAVDDGQRARENDEDGDESDIDDSRDPLTGRLPASAAS